MKAANKKSKFYNLTEPYFKKLNSNYAEALGRFMGKKWWSFLSFSLVLD
jgi:HAE1 family hydrophobic/amphiphilic exporter-1/multidrug efflux pump